jgi:adenosyl cobinamide kinase/adenosyl cobinamide phosphate guanylyltransferase
MTVTTDNIRDLLNRPRGLNDATITEYISIRTEQVNKSARNNAFLAEDSVNIVTTAQKESAIKALVCADCLQVMIDTLPSYVNDSEKKEQDIRLTAQLRGFIKRGEEMLALISEVGGTAVKFSQTKTRL